MSDIPFLQPVKSDPPERVHIGYRIHYEGGSQRDIPFTDLDVLPGVPLLLAFSLAEDSHIEKAYNMAKVDYIEAVYK